MGVLEEEKLNLKKALESLKVVLKNEKSRIDDIRKDWVREPDRYNLLLELTLSHYRALQSSLDKPYFGRIDFAEDGQDVESIYIGKHGYNDENDCQVVVDWRAPISTLYYDSDLGKCSYKAPSGIIEGNLELKRQFDIALGELLSYYDVDIVSNDELLQKYLNANNTARIKNIVSTIQSEQNNIIRRPINNNIVVQGVAGSGKTTVALHRIAYLVYNYKKLINQNSYLVIGPNKVFMKYIKSVLPDLDVEGVNQYTYEEFCKNIIDENFEIIDSSEKLNNYVNGETVDASDRIKCSMVYKQMLDLFLDDYLSNIVNDDLKIGNFVILSKEELLKIYNEELAENDNLNTIIDRVVIMGAKYIEANQGHIIKRLNDYFFDNFGKATSQIEKEKIKKEMLKVRSEVEKNCKTILKKYFEKYKQTPLRLYKTFLTNINNYNYQNLNCKTLKTLTLKNLKNNKIEFEDLAALMYLKYKISNNKDFYHIRHTIVDEGQDLGSFNYFVMKEILSNSTFSIFGDLAQSIYSYRGVSNWEELQSIFRDIDIINFNKSYRTTDEIMAVANKIAKHLGLLEAELAIRHGDDVTFSNVSENETEKIINIINNYKNKGHKTIAIVCKTNEDAIKLNEELRAKGLDIPNVGIDDDVTDSKYSICTISSSLVKGLEFDGVIVVNVDDKHYSSKNELDMKLLYVAITRALHNVELIYNNELTGALLTRKKTN